MSYYLYLPYSDHEITGYTNDLVERLKGKKVPIYRYEGDAQARALATMSVSDTLYVVGHGNYGKGIGTHMRYLDAKPLADRLQALGLPDLCVKIKLLACNTGARCGSLAAYGERFAAALRDLGYKQPRVYGYIGFVIASTFTPAKSHKKVAKLYNQQTTKIGDIGRASANRSEWNLAAPFPEHVPGLEWELAGFFKWSYKITP